MTSTRRTLLQRVRDLSDRVAWEEFYEIYAPLLERYARDHGLNEVDASEVRDECLAVVARKMPSFEYGASAGGARPRASFKGWLYLIAKGKVIDRLRRPAERQANSQELRLALDPLPTPDELWECHWRVEHLKYGLDVVRRSEPEHNFRAFEMLLLEELSVADVCERMGWNSNQVYKAKSRVLKRVREALERLGADDGPGFS